MAGAATSPTFSTVLPVVPPTPAQRPAAQLSPPAGNGFATSSSASSAATAAAASDEITTIFVVGFPDDMHEREFQNIFMFASGFEASMLKLPSPEELSDSKKQIIGFAKFRSRLEAQRAKDFLNGKKVDNERTSVLKVEMAKKNLHVKRGHPQQQASTSMTAHETAASQPAVADNGITQVTSSFDSLLLRRARAAAEQSAVRADSALQSPQLQNSRRPLDVDVVSPGNGLDQLLAEFRLVGPMSAPLLDGRSLLSEQRSMPTSPIAETSSAAPPAAGQLPLSPLSIFSSFPSMPGAANNSRNPLNATMATGPLSPSLTGSSALSAPAAFANARATTVVDQNPPCNTLYVGNLSSNSSEEELRRIFSTCPGYKRMSFKIKANGPMCFVEFEDVGFATQALQRLQGTLLSTSVKGGIRLSYSKNPLGVRAQKLTLNLSTGRLSQNLPAGPASAPPTTTFSPLLGRDFIASALSRSALRENWANLPNVAMADSSLGLDVSSPTAAAALANVLEFVRGPGEFSGAGMGQIPTSQAFGASHGVSASPGVGRLAALLNRDNGEGASNCSLFSGIIGER